MEKIKHKLPAAVLITVIAVILLNIVCVIRYETGDDFMLNRLVSGVSVERDPHLYYINDLLGRLFVVLYSAAPSIPWYGITEYALMLGGMIALVWLILRRRTPFYALFLILLTLCFGYEFFIKVQFTKVGAFAGIAGALLLIELIDSGERKVLPFAAGCALMLLGSFYRPVMFLAALGAIFPYGVSRILKSRKTRETCMRYLIVFPAIMAACGILYLVHAQDYRGSDGWKEYKTFVDDERKLNDFGYPDYEENRAVYESVDVNRNALSLYQHMSIADPEKYTVENIMTLVGAKEKRPFSFGALAEFFRLLFIQIVRNYPYFIAVAAAVVAMVLVRRKLPLVMLCSFGMILLFHIALFFSGRVFANRVDVGLYFGAFMTAVMLAGEGGEGTEETEQPQGKRKALFLLGQCVAGALLMLLISAGYRGIVPGENGVDVTAEDALTADSRREFYDLIQGDRDSLYLMGTYLYPSCFRPFDVIEPESVTNQVQLGSWQTFSPVDRKIWEKNGVTNPFRSMIEREDALLVTVFADETLKYLNDYYGEGYWLVMVKDVLGYRVYRVMDAEKQEREAIDPGSIRDAGADTQIYAEATEDTEAGALLLTGSMFRDGENSFCNHYSVIVENADGTVDRNDAVQKENPFAGDLYHGRFSAFEAVIAAPEKDAKIYLVCENGGKAEKKEILVFPQGL